MLAMRRQGSAMMHDYDAGTMHGSGSWVTLLVGFLLFLALIWLAVYWIARATSPPSTRPLSRPAAPAPRDVLDLRLARGEITPEEYGATTRLLDRSA